MSYQGTRTASPVRATSPRYGGYSGVRPASPNYYGRQGPTYGGYYGPRSPYRGGYYGAPIYGPSIYTAPIVAPGYGYGYPYGYGYANPATAPLLAATAATAGLIGLATAPRYY